MAKPNKVNTYYKFLFENFGHAECSGCLILSKAIELYDLNKIIAITELYKELAKEFNLTPWAVERNIRFYIGKILEEVSVAELSNFLHYNFKTGDNTVTAKVLIPAIKCYVDNN